MIRVLFITNTPPIPSWGGAMAFYRHFCERGDFEIFVVTDDPGIRDYKVPYEYSVINKGAAWTRIANTRYYRYAHTFSHLFSAWDVNDSVKKQIKEFNPQAVFTVAGSWSWMAILANRVAKKMRVPLIASFNDWWDYSMIYHPFFKKAIERKFYNYYKACDLALCTSEGMKKALGEHQNAVVTYPTGALIETEKKVAAARDSAKKFTLAFTGNMGNWYGRMLEQIVTSNREKDISFEFYGSNPGWSNKFDQEVKQMNVLKGQVLFEELKSKMENVDALLLLMGFDEEAKQIESTSFKTKFLDYLSFQKPILLWGPDYCTAVEIAKRYDSAEICTNPDPQKFMEKINTLKKDKKRQRQLVENALRMYNEKFHPDVIHNVLLKSIRNLIS